MGETWRQIAENYAMGIYLRILAIITAYGALVHLTNLMGIRSNALG